MPKTIDIANVEFASYTQRICARLVDFILAIILCSFFLEAVGVKIPKNQDTIGNAHFYLWMLYIPLVFIAYELPGLATSGMTLGKRMMGICVVRTDGQIGIGFLRALRRICLPLLMFIFGPLYLIGQGWFFFDARRQNVGDKIAHTYVIRIPSANQPTHAHPGELPVAMADSRRERQKKNRARREALAERTAIAYRRRKGIGDDEEEALLASYVRRFFALALDNIFFIIIAVLFVIFETLYYGSDSHPVWLNYMPIYLFGIFYLVPVIQKNGQTFGAKKTRIQIIRQDGSGLLTWKQSSLRWFTMYGLPNTITFGLAYLNLSWSAGLPVVSALLTILTLLPAFKTENRQGLADLVAGSIVVRELKY